MPDTPGRSLYRLFPKNPVTHIRNHIQNDEDKNPNFELNRKITSKNVKYILTVLKVFLPSLI